MGSFSGILKLSDLNDFIGPSQACVVNLRGANLPEPEIQVDRPRKATGFQQTRTAEDTGAVKVSLNDCLACSGCVTSAETVLLEHQSLDELRSKLQQADVTVIASLSPQSRASLAKALGLSPIELQERLVHFLKSLGVSQVFDTTCTRDFSLMESAAEFCARHQSHSQASTSEQSLPMLASACPGWVCYAEKTHGSYILPYISTAKSPQAVMGSLIKQYLGRKMGRPPEAIYHVAIMPCYDKKLEASREDFLTPGSTAEPVPETDSVLTTGEVYELLEAHGTRLQDTPRAALDCLPGTPPLTPPGAWPGGSGGYLEYIYRTAAERLYGVKVPPGPLEMRTLRNADLKEISLVVAGRPVLRFAQAYGFRNIQTLVQKMKRRACQYDFVEVMACPSGCLNGGGQIKPAADETPKQLLERLDQLYHDPELQCRWPEDNPTVQALYREWIQGDVHGANARQLLHTQYHHREAPATSKLNDW